MARQTIWKFPVCFTDRQTVDMPLGAKVLSVQAQRGAPCIWALVDPRAEVEPVGILCHGTGHQVGDVGAFIGTVQVAGGSLVFHFFRARDNQ